MSLLVGCFVVPSTYTKQANGKPRPESLVGRDADDAIVLGRTRIEDALIAIRDESGGSYGGAIGLLASGNGRLPLTNWMMWSLGADGRSIGVNYELVTGTAVFPLCFSAVPKRDARVMRLTYDANGIVTRVDTLEPEDEATRGTVSAYRNPTAILAALPPAARQRLVAAGAFPDDGELQRLADQRKPVSRPTSEPIPAPPGRLATSRPQTQASMSEGDRK